jgi:predicted nucleotidyltransferase
MVACNLAIRTFALRTNSRCGRFYVFGPVAAGRIKYDSDFDVVVDFPFEIEAEAADFVEEACQRRRIPSDVHFKSRASQRFLDRIRNHWCRCHER